MENVFSTEKEHIRRVYDLKGSSYSRQVLKGQSLDIIRRSNSIIKKTLKDIDFINIDK